MSIEELENILHRLIQMGNELFEGVEAYTEEKVIEEIEKFYNYYANVNVINMKTYVAENELINFLAGVDNQVTIDPRTNELNIDYKKTLIMRFLKYKWNIIKSKTLENIEKAKSIEQDDDKKRKLIINIYSFINDYYAIIRNFFNSIPYRGNKFKLSKSIFNPNGEVAYIPDYLAEKTKVNSLILKNFVLEYINSNNDNNFGEKVIQIAYFGSLSDELLDGKYDIESLADTGFFNVGTNNYKVKIINMTPKKVTENYAIFTDNDGLEGDIFDSEFLKQVSNKYHMLFVSDMNCLCDKCVSPSRNEYTWRDKMARVIRKKDFDKGYYKLGDKYIERFFDNYEYMLLLLLDKYANMYTILSNRLCQNIYQLDNPYVYILESDNSSLLGELDIPLIKKCRNDFNHTIKRMGFRTSLNVYKPNRNLGYRITDDYDCCINEDCTNQIYINMLDLLLSYFGDSIKELIPEKDYKEFIYEAANCYYALNYDEYINTNIPNPKEPDPNCKFYFNVVYDMEKCPSPKFIEQFKCYSDTINHCNRMFFDKFIKELMLITTPNIRGAILPLCHFGGRSLPIELDENISFNRDCIRINSLEEQNKYISIINGLEASETNSEILNHSPFWKRITIELFEKSMGLDEHTGDKWIEKNIFPQLAITLKCYCYSPKGYPRIEYLLCTEYFELDKLYAQENRKKLERIRKQDN